MNLRKPLFLIVAFVLIGTARGQSLYINEVMASNGETIADEDGDFEDWIEIYNAGEENVNLLGFGLSDDSSNTYKWVFPDTIINAGTFMVVWASGKDRKVSGKELHTNYSISGDGEEIIITDPNGNILDEMEPIAIPRDVSYGKQPDGTGEWKFFETPTPGNSNNDSEGLEGVLEPPVFSHQGGFYTEEFELTISHPDPEVTIYYTLDGSEPNPNNLGGKTFRYKDKYVEDPNDDDGELIELNLYTIEYSNPIAIYNRDNESDFISRIPSTWHNTPFYLPKDPISKAFVVKAIAIKDGFRKSSMINSFFHVNYKGISRYTLPIISLSLDPYYLFDYDSGIYVAGVDFDNWRNANPTLNPASSNSNADGNYNRREETEISGFLDFFHPKESNSTINTQLLGVRIHGGMTRNRPNKSLRLYARSSYGSDQIPNLFFNSTIDAYRRLILRNSGNDSYSTMLRDASIQQILKGTNVETQDYQPSILFLNGEYWGIYNVRERYDLYYFTEKYGLSEDQIDLLTIGGQVIEGTNEAYIDLFSFVENNDLNDLENYNYVKSKIDISNYITYYALNIFIGNTDWPHNNLDFWRSKNISDPTKEEHDGRFRWIVYDTDYGLGFEKDIESYKFNMVDWVTREHWSNSLFNRLISSELFQVDFIQQFSNLLNIHFDSTRIENIIADNKLKIEQEIDEHIDRWSMPEDKQSWHDNINSMIQFVNKRHKYQWSHLQDYFDLGQINSLTLSDDTLSNYGWIQINGLDLNPHELEDIGYNFSYPWTGRFFEDIPINLVAKADRGYQFSHWVGLPDSLKYENPVSFYLENDMEVKAIFVKGPPINPHVLVGSNFELLNLSPSKNESPDHCEFYFMNVVDPGLESAAEGFTFGRFDYESRTRVNGLNEFGFSMINTANEDGNPGYPGTRLGAFAVALDTRDVGEAYVTFKAGTINANSRLYNIRMRYKIGEEGSWIDLPDAENDIIEYQADMISMHQKEFEAIPLPEELLNQEYVEIIWQYYFTGQQIDENSGQRSELRLDDIIISREPFYYNSNKSAFDLSTGTFRFDQLMPDEQVDSIPHLYFAYMDEIDPGISASIRGNTYGPFNYDSRSRINGLGAEGLSFINTGNEEGQLGYPGTRLGAALIKVQPKEQTETKLSFNTRTIEQNGRIYALRLRYLNDNGLLVDILDKNQQLIDYIAEETNILHEFNDIAIPHEAFNSDNEATIVWQYYFTGAQGEGGARSELALKDIYFYPFDGLVVLNYPNEYVPFDEFTGRFSWQGDDDAYDFELALDGDFDNIIFKSDSIESDNIFVDLEWSTQEKYYWRVKKTFYFNEWTVSEFYLNQLLNATGVDEYEILIFPNPTTSILNIHSSNELITEVRLLRIDGREKLRKTIPRENMVRINLSGINAGIYLIELTLSNGERITNKIVLK